MMDSERYVANYQGDKIVSIHDKKNNNELVNVIQLIDRLNIQENKIIELEIRNKRQFKRLHNLGDLMFKRDWDALEKIVEDWEKEEEQQRKYGV